MVAVFSSNTASFRRLHIAGSTQSEVKVPDHNAVEWESAVAVVAEGAHDSNRISRLLSRDSQVSLAVSEYPVDKLVPHDAFAAVVVHRQRPNDNYTTLTLAPIRGRLIVLSDCTRESTVVRLLERGAVQVFNLNDSDVVLQARLAAALRRHRSFLMRSFTVADVHFDVHQRKVIRNGVSIDLSPKEFDFASYIFSRTGEVVVNSELMTSVWSLPLHMDTRRIDTAACRVRKKLGLDGDSGWDLKRIRCVGYRLTRTQSNVFVLGG